MVDKSGGLVRPPAGLGQFVDFKTSIHGITAEMVASAAPWRRVAAWVADYAGRDILIAHNAGFNIGVLRHACTAEKIPWPQANFLCTMVLARKAFQLPSYRLAFVAAEYGVELVGCHQVLCLVTPDASPKSLTACPCPSLRFDRTAWSKFLARL